MSRKNVILELNEYIDVLNNSECGICLEKYNTINNIYKTKCCHFFCKKCDQKMEKKIINNCPYCRTKILKKQNCRTKIIKKRNDININVLNIEDVVYNNVNLSDFVIIDRYLQGFGGISYSELFNTSIKSLGLKLIYNGINIDFA